MGRRRPPGAEGQGRVRVARPRDPSRSGAGVGTPSSWSRPSSRSPAGHGCPRTDGQEGLDSRPNLRGPHDFRVGTRDRTVPRPSHGPHPCLPGGLNDRRPDVGPPLRPSHDGPQPRLHAGGGPHPGPGHRGQHGDIHPDGSGAAAGPSREGSRAAGRAGRSRAQLRDRATARARASPASPIRCTSTSGTRPRSSTGCWPTGRRPCTSA